MNKKILLFIFISFFSFSLFVFAENDLVEKENYILVSQNEKYYKTVNVINIDNSFNKDNLREKNIIMSYTTEISFDEYENPEDDYISYSKGSSNYIQTEYKKLTVSILENGTKYKYKAVLNWRKMPAVRSYDIIGIGFYQSVRAYNYTYNTYYCLDSGPCYTDTNYSPKSTSTGVGASFKLPSSDRVNTLINTLTVYVEKNTSSTITQQKAVADYSHATSNILGNLSTNYSINTNGITLNGISSYYDNMSYVSTTFNCNW